MEMPIEEQVVSREIGNELLNLGVKMKSYFVWHQRGKKWEIIESHACGCMGTIPAYTVAELGDIFPYNVQLPFRVKDTFRNEKVWIWSTNSGRQGIDTEVNARGKMLIYLLKNNLLVL